MQVNFNPNTHMTNNNKPSFGQINLVGGSKEVLKSILKPKELTELQKIAATQANNPVNITLFGRSNHSKKLDARILPESDYIRNKVLSQRIFESTMGFIKRCVKKADEFKAKLDDMGDIDANKILDNLSSYN